MSLCAIPLLFRMQHRRVIFLIAVAVAAVERSFAVGLAPDLDRHRDLVLPFLGTFCLDCHDADVRKGDVRLDTADPDLVHGTGTELWKDVLRRLETREMPPKKKKTQPTLAEREAVAAWIRRELKKHLTAQVGVPGRVVIRRLSRDEYQNTMRDLLGLPQVIGDELPPDTRYQGFDHVAETQELSPSQLRMYLDLAREAIDAAIPAGPRPLSVLYRHEVEGGKETTEWTVRTHGVPAHEAWFTAGREDRQLRGRLPERPGDWFHVYFFNMQSNSRGTTFDGRGAWLAASHSVYEDQHNPWGLIRYKLPWVPEDAKRQVVRLRIKAGSSPRDDWGNPIMTVFLFKHLVGDFEVTAPADDPQWIEWVGTVADLPKPALRERDSRFRKTPCTDLTINNSYENPGTKGHKWSLDRDTEIPPLFVDAWELEIGHAPEWPPPSQERILFDSPTRENDPPAYAREVLRRFMSRAFRRPVREPELDRKLALFENCYEESQDFVAAIKIPLIATLVSPQFLFLNEDAEPDAKARRKLNGYELASRLSYFLWSTMPDADLLAEAASGDLLVPAHLRRQVDRMLDDERAAALHCGFMREWLRLDKLETLPIEDDRWVVSDQLKRAMYAEPQHFFGEMLRGNLNLLRFVESDFTMLNERLAIHYGIPGVYGDHFRRVSLRPEHGRGGLLTQAASMTVTTDGMVQNPIYRGVWILDRLLDRAPPAAPANVPPLEDAPKERLELREQFRQHREVAGCATCHQKIDPIGWPLERYSILGEYSDFGWGPNWRRYWDERSNRKGEKPDLHGQFPDGTRVETAADVKRVILEKHRDDVLRSVANNLMIYALGRPLDLSDEEEVQRVITHLAQNDFKTRELIHAVVQSRPFLLK